MMVFPKIDRGGWLAVWLQKRRRERQQPTSFDAPSLITLGTVTGDTTWQAVAPVVVDDWQFCTTDTPFDPEVKSFDEWVADADFPDTEFVVINPTTATFTVDFAYCAARYRVGATWSSWTNVVPKTVIAPTAPSLVSLGTVTGDTTWQAAATVAVDAWQFCTTDTPFDPEVKSFDEWVADADFPDTEYIVINSTTATVTVDFAYCAARYRIGTTWSSWTGVLDATVIPPPGQLVEPTLAFVSGYFQGTAPVPASVWQFAQSDSVYESGSVQTWVDGADQSDMDYDLLPPNQAQSERTLSYCTCRYQVDGVWSPWCPVI
jgi:hypothetical protein